MHIPYNVIVADFFVFSAVAATLGNCVKINSTTRFLIQNKNKNSNQIWVLKYKHQEIIINKEDFL